VPKYITPLNLGISSETHATNTKQPTDMVPSAAQSGDPFFGVAPVFTPVLGGFILRRMADATGE
jgi:hypothetical protein